MEVEKWIDISVENPAEVGWYKIRTTIGDYVAAYSRDAAGNFIWVVPDLTIVTHWKPNPSI